MISKRKDPDILNTSKPILETPVYTEMQKGTLGTDLPSQNPDLLREDDDDTDDITNEVDDATLIGLEEEDDEDLDR